MAYLEITDNAAQADIAVIERGLADYAQQSGVQPMKFRPLAVLSRDAHGNVEAGLYGTTFWAACYFDGFWVRPDIRGKGIGRKLLRAAENEAYKRGCLTIYLWTQTFQAPAFYEKQGYQRFVVMPDFPVGHQRIGFMKRLAVA